MFIEADSKKVNGEIFNAGWQNMSVNNIAETVKIILEKMLK